MSHTLLVVAHPRSDALTTQVATRLHTLIQNTGDTIDVLDLYTEQFDPLLTPADEPDWHNRDKRYSPDVHAHMDRLTAADDILVVFPVWWFSVPAVLKGWIDRVFNYGFAYGRSSPQLAGKRMLWLGLAGLPQEHYAETGLGEALDLQLRTGVSEFCGMTRSAVRLLYGTELSGIPTGQRPATVQDVLTAAETALREVFGHRAPHEPASTSVPAAALPRGTAADRSVTR